MTINHFQNDYKNHDVVKGAQGIKILAKDLEKALAGLPLMVAQQEDEVDILKVSHCFL